MLDVRFNELNLLAVVSLIKRRINVLVVARNVNVRVVDQGIWAQSGVDGSFTVGRRWTGFLTKRIVSRFIMNHFMTFKVMRLGDES